MKLILIILLLWAFSANATNYYIKNSGNDALDGLTDATAWASLSKIKSGSFSAGDSILLKRGDTFNDSIRIVASGINIGAYGTGNNPIVTGFRLMTLTLKGSNIYQGYSSGLVKDLNCVLVNNKMEKKARWPNSDSANAGFLTAQSATTYTLTSSSLTGMPDYTGVECIVRTAHYIDDKVKVSSQSGSTLTFRDPLTYNGFQFGANGFFFQNDSSFLDQEGEWYNDSASHRFLVYSTSVPVVYESVIDTLIRTYNATNVGINNLTISGANRMGIDIDSSKNTTLNADSVINMGKMAIYIRAGKRLTVKNSVIKDVFTNGIEARDAIYYSAGNPSAFLNNCDTAKIFDNEFKNIGLSAGMCQWQYGNTNGENNAIYITGDSNDIYYNRFDSIGHNGIHWTGPGTHIHKNYFTNSCVIKDDAGALMTNLANVIWPAGFDKGSVIDSNIIINSIGQDAGSNVPSFATGIYLDANSKGIEIYNNLCFNGHYSVFYPNIVDSVYAHNNIFANNNGNVCQYSFGAPWSTGAHNRFTNNVFYTNGSNAYNNALINFFNIAEVGTLDSNYYLKPNGSIYPFTTNGNPIFYSTSLTFFGGDHDVHSTQSPGAITSNTAYIIYNPTKVDSTIVLPQGIYSEPNGTIYNSTIVLHEYESKILFRISVSSNKIYNRTFRIK